MFDNYVNNYDFTKEYNNVSQLISENRESEAIDELYNYSYCIYEKLSIIERKKLLSAFAGKTNLLENYEDMVLNLIRSTYSSDDKGEIVKVLDHIFNEKAERSFFGELIDKRKRSLFDVLSTNIDNFNGKQNYAEWIKELTNLFTAAYSEELKTGKYPESKTVFPSGFVIKNSTPYYFYNWSKIGGMNVQLKSDKYRIPLVNGVIDLNPNDIVNVGFNRKFTFIPEGTKPVIAIPAFCLAYLLNHEDDAIKEDIAKFIITCTNIYGAGRKLIVTKGSKIIPSLLLLKDVADPVFSNNDFQDWAKRELGMSKDFFTYWDYINALEITKANVNTIVGVVTKQNWFGTFYTNWKAVQANKALNNKISKTTVDELNKAIEDVKNHLDSENIIY
ncbi:hypothetical protein EV201_1226 [Ancylomarina subtilis]|uniref:Uncharacterized protein n=1 Tax=Ancylomarina subtilis TaxID=1639035 RepID=A0A4Q7VKN2_9BACT|nr:hypothetical protein [Ancylomarina subtilis]RZT96588.1 hypothetical protein EV201_1226 [Ancylomarina subtilis]